MAVVELPIATIVVPIQTDLPANMEPIIILMASPIQPTSIPAKGGGPAAGAKPLDILYTTRPSQLPYSENFNLFTKIA